MTDPDPRGLIRESYRIEGITTPECRSIFFDWALSLSEEVEARQAIDTLLDHYAGDHPDHPMTAVLREGLAPTDPRPKRGRRRSVT